MAIDGDHAKHGNNISGNMISETALEWFDRCQKHGNSGSRKRPRREDASCRNEEDSTEDPSTAAWRFLRFGKSGIAPIDEVWKRSATSGRSEPTRGHSPAMFLPPVTILEGPKDVGKTWMLLTLAARFVVATRASRFKDYHTSDEDNKNQEIDGLEINTDEDSTRNKDNQDRPKVLLLDSTYDFSMPQLVNVVHSTLMRERQKDREAVLKRNRQRGPQSQSGKEVYTNEELSDRDGGRRVDNQNENRPEPRQTIEDELDRQKQEKNFLEKDMEDCLSRIHIIQVDNGPTGWVAMLEALAYQLSNDRSNHNNEWNTGNEKANGSPTLLLWDGFLSDMSLPTNAIMAQKASVVLGESYSNYNNPQLLFESPSTQEVLIQLSRLLQKQCDSLWLVLTTRTVPVATSATTNDKVVDKHNTRTTTEQSGIGSRLTEWIRKEEEKRRRGHDGSARERQEASIRYRPNQQHRASYRIRLDRRHDGRGTGDGHIPNTTAAAAALFAKVIGSGEGRPSAAENTTTSSANRTMNAANNGEIPYSISVGGILS